MEVKKRGVFAVVLALFLVLLLPTLVEAAQGGCYTFVKGDPELYCEAGVLDSAAQADCSKHPTCKFNQYFTPGSDCSGIEECEKVLCPVNCQEMAWGFCKEFGKKEGRDPVKISPSDSNYKQNYDLWCGNPYGCCQFPVPQKEPFCQFGLNRYKCQLSAQQKGVDPASSFFIFDSSLGMNPKTCNEKYCKLAILPANVEVSVYDEETRQPLSGAKIEVEGEGQTFTTGTSGKTQFTLPPKTYIFTITADYYASFSKTVPLSSNASVLLNLTLKKTTASLNLSGKVTDVNGKGIPQATVSWGELSSERTSTDSEGKYNVEGFVPGKQEFSASAVGYLLLKKNITLESGKENILNFILNKTSLPTLSGKTYVDENQNNLSDPGEIVYGANIYLDGEFRGISTYPDGSYSFTLAPSPEMMKESYKVTATFQDYEIRNYVLKTEENVANYVKSLLLSKTVGECSPDGPNPTKNIEVFSAQQVLGEKKVALSWERPCPEVISYILEKYEGTVFVKEETLAPTALNFEDKEVEWGKTYSYKITAVYDGTRKSESPAEQTITLGDEQCEGKYHGPEVKWETFCFGEDQDTRRIVWTCDDHNKIVPSTDCKGSDGVSSSGIPSIYYCAKITPTEATCKDSGACSLFSNPFGLYSSRDECYGSFGKNNKGAKYCYYDHTSSVVERCDSCINIKSCFDYKGKDACTVNNCLDQSCQWTDGAANNELIDYTFLNLNLPTLVTSETGAGYCTEQNYVKDDRCYLCSPKVTLFKNYFCSAEVCSALGSCFSADQLKRCQSCGNAPTAEANCYTYSTQKECTSNQSVSVDEWGKSLKSKDRCGWGTCLWKSDSSGGNNCVKDGNYDGEDDCIVFVDVGQQAACKRDNTPPLTKITSTGTLILSLTQTNLTFESSDEHSGEKTNSMQSNPLGELYYCLTDANPDAADTCKYPFSNSVEYVKNLPKESVGVNLIQALAGEEIDRKTYRLKYYSTDKYFNAENIKEAAVYVDNVPPKFEINETINTVLDKTTLNVYLTGLNEPMNCLFELRPLLPLGASITKPSSSQGLGHSANFTDLSGMVYTLMVNCTDLQGNSYNRPENYVFDLNQQIQVIHPEQNGVVAETSIPFHIQTLLGSTCSLYQTSTNEKVADFKTDAEGKDHLTDPVPGFYEREYVAEYKVVCTELLSQNVSEEVLNFRVSFSSPSTEIVLSEGSRQFNPAENNWEAYFISSAQAELTCVPAEGGFPCAKTFYCLGKGCEFKGSPNYQEYNGSLILSNTLQICYYSMDTANNPVYQPACGNVIIDGYGIHLKQPPLYYYLGEEWGIRNTPTFDWEFFTRVPAAECGFDYASRYNYKELPEHQYKSALGESTFLFEDFPKSVFSEFDSGGGIKTVYVKCKNGEGLLSPEKKMNLEFDPTPPTILEAYTDPQAVIEGTYTTIFANTDDKTLCKFSDNSLGNGKSEYSLMEYAFPGVGNNTLDFTHNQTLTITGVDAQGEKDYSLLVQCKNGADDFSEPKEVNFHVDYSVVGFILSGSLRPSGSINIRSTELGLSTSKNAKCEYRGGPLQRLNSSVYTLMLGEGTKQHTSPVGGLVDGFYKYPVRCVMQSHTSEAEIQFTIDTVAPVLSGVQDGNYSCGSDKIKVMVYSPEVNISGYYYEVYDLGSNAVNIEKAEAAAKALFNKTTYVSNTSTIASYGSAYSSYLSSVTPKTNASQVLVQTKIMVMNGSVGPALPLEIPTSALNQTHRYMVKVRAGDAAGNLGDFKESDGFDVISKNYTLCKIDNSAPKITLNVNDSCSLASPLLSIRCEDETGCKDLKYGRAGSKKDCQVNLTYNGNNIALNKKEYFCYFASDNRGNNMTGSEAVVLNDGDGDGVLNHCDNCSNTKPNAIVDLKGCSNQDVDNIKNETDAKTDSDDDGLSDAWEKSHNAQGCPFDYLLDDSDADGKDDARDDYDEDGYTNYQEFLYDTDPCSAEDVPKISGFEPGTLEENETLFTPTAPVTPTTPITPKAPGGNLAAWILLIIGLLLTLGGGGYLIYYYQSGPSKPSTSAGPSRAYTPTSYYPGKAPTEGWAERFLQFKRSREEKVKQKSREGIFQGFSTESKNIPHVDKILSSKAPVEQKLQQVAQKYSEHKEEMHPGLKPQEKSLFAKLESLSQKSKDSSMNISKDQSQDLFNKLKKMSQKRKE